MLTLNHLLSLAVVLAAGCFLSADGQNPPACNLAVTGTWYQDPNTPCSKDFQVCRSYLWRKNRCVLGHFNATVGLCQRFSSGCNINDNDIYYPGNNTPGRKRREVSVSETSETSKTSELLHRSKRQGTDCSGVPAFPCPAQVKQVIIYPNFDYLGCSDFYLCLEGDLKLVNCPSAEGLVYYNPRLQSCEEYPGLTNTCVWRDYGDYEPFNGTI